MSEMWHWAGDHPILFTWLAAIAIVCATGIVTGIFNALETIFGPERDD